MNCPRISQTMSDPTNTWTCYKSLSRQKREKEKKRERLVILGMLINIHELSSLASILIITGLLSTVSSKLESAIVNSLCCIIVLSKHMIGYWFFVKECRLDRILSSQGPSLPSITSLSRFFFLLPFLPRKRLVASPTNTQSFARFQRNLEDHLSRKVGSNGL